MGVRPLLPQYRQAQIKPLSFGEKLTAAGGKVPTERGEIEVHWERKNGQFLMRLVLPANIQAKVILPRVNHSTKGVIVDGAVVEGSIEGAHIVVDSVGSGSHTFLIE